MTDFNITFTKAGYLITVNLLFLGLGNLFWIPLSEKIGKRPVLIACSGLFFVSTIWAAASRSWGSLFGARIVQGFAASVSEGLGPVIVADVYFLHERGLWVGVNLLTFTVGTSLGGIFSGLIANATPNWHWVYWHQVFLTGMLFLVIVLFQAETNFDRPPENESGEGLPASQLAAIRARVKSRWIKSLSVTLWYNRYVKILCVIPAACGGCSAGAYISLSLSLTYLPSTAVASFRSGGSGGVPSSHCASQPSGSASSPTAYAWAGFRSKSQPKVPFSLPCTISLLSPWETSAVR